MITYNRNASDKVLSIGKGIVSDCLSGGGEKISSGKLIGCMESRRAKAIFSDAPKRTSVIAAAMDSKTFLSITYKGDRASADARAEVKRILVDFPAIWSKLYD